MYMAGLLSECIELFSSGDFFYIKFNECQLQCQLHVLRASLGANLIPETQIGKRGYQKRKSKNVDTGNANLKPNVWKTQMGWREQ